jgi:hypothetical protein
VKKQNIKDDLENLSPTFQDSFDLFVENKHDDQSEKRREERKRKIESIKTKFKEERAVEVDVENTKEKDLSDQNPNVPSCSHKLDSHHFHMTPEQTEKLLRILEEEREINMIEGKIKIV